MTEIRPERLNLAIGRRCFVECQGCYQFFGQNEPDLKAIEASVTQFVRLGVRKITLSGGDPLTLRNLDEFLENLRVAGVNEIKLDTVGTSLLVPGSKSTTPKVLVESLRNLLSHIDYVGLPLDGGSNRTVGLFRAGRAKLYDETIALLNASDTSIGRRAVVINTVVHRLNLEDMQRILTVVSLHPSIIHWNLFQYTPTDQVSDKINRKFSINERTFLNTSAAILQAVTALPPGQRHFSVEARTIQSRLGQYLLINSDGQCWVPDEVGRTIALGPVSGREKLVLTSWANTVLRLRKAAALIHPSHSVVTWGSLQESRLAEVR
jgi:pyruvate-formate lyase-activating enzyme